VDSFQRSGGANIIILNHKSEVGGINSNASSEVLMMELPWTQADCEQCEARCHRMVNQANVRATYLLGENTLDQWFYDIIQERKSDSK
jgi:SWI/SNF-related matrix-associated actin-dependent regulator 1 of chromatin subfamily A